MSLKKIINFILFITIAFFSVWYIAYKNNPKSVCGIHPDPTKRANYQWCGIGPVMFSFHKRTFIDSYAPKWLDKKQRRLRNHRLFESED